MFENMYSSYSSPSIACIGILVFARFGRHVSIWCPKKKLDPWELTSLWNNHLLIYTNIIMACDNPTIAK